MQKGIADNLIDLDAKFAVLKTENWSFLKENFPVDKVMLVGLYSDFYKAYCIDTTMGKALYFDIKSQNCLNDISIIDTKNIFVGEFTKEVSVESAISLLENCSYDAASKPNEEKFKELIELLKINSDRKLGYS